MKDAGKNGSENVCRFTDVFRLQIYGRTIMLHGRFPVQKSSQKRLQIRRRFSSANLQTENHAPSSVSP